MLTAFTVFCVVMLLIILKTFVVVQMREACLVERLGKFRKVLLPGFHFMIPFFDRVAYRLETREQVIDIPSQSCITQDNMQVEVDGLVYLKVVDPYKASYGIGNYHLAAVNLAQTTMRSEVGKLTLSKTFSERDTLNERIVKEIDLASEPWGVKVLRYELMNIIPSNNVVATLEKQMEAERTKRAEITLATAEKESKINISEGQRQRAVNISEGERQKRINEAKGKAHEIKLVAEATARGIGMVSTAIQTEGGSIAVKMKLLDQFISEVGRVMNSSKVSILPAEMANIRGLFEGFNKVTSTLESKK